MIYVCYKGAPSVDARLTSFEGPHKITLSQHTFYMFKNQYSNKKKLLELQCNCKVRIEDLKYSSTCWFQQSQCNLKFCSSMIKGGGGKLIDTLFPKALKS